MMTYNTCSESFLFLCCKVGFPPSSQLVGGGVLTSYNTMMKAFISRQQMKAEELGSWIYNIIKLRCSLGIFRNCLGLNMTHGKNMR
jgi:hypothetical protein